MLTCTVVEWLPVSTRPETAQVLFYAWIWQQGNVGLTLFGFVVLENHLHAVAQAPDLPAAWTQFKSFTARRLIQILDAHGARRLLDRMLVPSKTQRPDRSDRQGGAAPQERCHQWKTGS